MNWLVTSFSVVAIDGLFIVLFSTTQYFARPGLVCQRCSGNQSWSVHFHSPALTLFPAYCIQALTMCAFQSFSFPQTHSEICIILHEIIVCANVRYANLVCNSSKWKQKADKEGQKLSSLSCSQNLFVESINLSGQWSENKKIFWAFCEIFDKIDGGCAFFLSLFNSSRYRARTPNIVR